MTSARTVAWFGTLIGVLFVPTVVERWSVSEQHPPDEPERTEQRHVYVLGAVNQPGRQPVLELHGGGGFTLAKAMAMAEDLRPDADRRRIRVFRNDRFLLEVDFDEILDGDRPDVPIGSGDVVYVPMRPR